MFKIRTLFSPIGNALDDPQSLSHPTLSQITEPGPCYFVRCSYFITTSTRIMATPVTTPLAAASIAPAILSLSKRAWKLGAAISKLDQYSEVTDTTVTVLTESVKSFGNECDLVYAELEMAMGSRDAGSPLLHYVDAKTWYCLETQAKETSQTMHELEAFVERIGSEQSYFIGRAQRPLTLSQNKKDIGGVQIRLCRHTDNLRTILLLINM